MFSTVMCAAVLFMSHYLSACSSEMTLFVSFPSFPLQVSGLKPAQKYLYRVRAENAAGVSDPAEQVGPLLADDPHGMRGTI